LSPDTHRQIQSSIEVDAVLQQLRDVVMKGWPDTCDQVPVYFHEYWNFRDKIRAHNGVLYKGMKVIVPSSMRSSMIVKAHTSHLGSDACVRRAKDVLYWPGMVGEIKDNVKSCQTCNDLLAKQQTEPLMTHTIPTLLWSKVGQVS